VDRAMARSADRAAARIERVAQRRIDRALEGAFDGVVIAEGATGVRGPVIKLDRDGNPVLVIRQTEDHAIVRWESFDVARGETVRYRQGGNEDWTILNRIGGDHASEIAGGIKADAQVYLINGRGIRFTESARVEVPGFVASSLDITDARFQAGIATPDPTTDFIVFDFERSALTAPEDLGTIDIDRGAILFAPEGGRIILLGREVNNAGTISAPSGQVLIGAGERARISPLPPDNALRTGLDLGMNRGFSTDIGGTVTNTGTILAETGNVTIASLTVEQSGTIMATTSVDRVGSIVIKAQDGIAPDPTTTDPTAPPVAVRNGIVTFGGGSLTAVLPEAGDHSTITTNQAFDPSFIGLIGHQIAFEAGSTLLAPGGSVAVDLRPTTFFSADAGRLFMADGSLIDVSGTTDTEIAMARNIIAVQLGRNELANAPLQRDFLLNRTITIDVREGTPIADVQGYVDGVGRTVSELLAGGGAVSIAGEGDVILDQGSVIDISGGFVTYKGGYVRTTVLQDAYGRGGGGGGGKDLR
jgi:filamentous hemagglutinin